MSRILVIDDNPSVRHIVKATLRSPDLEVLEAGSAGEGLVSARRHVPELVICDLNLGDSTGWDVLEGMRRDAAMATIPVILITGEDDGLAMRRGMDLGADDFLTKPFTRDQLLASVQARLRKQGAVRHQTEQANRRLLELVEATEDMVAVVDAHTQVVRHLNRSARRITGLDPDREGQPVRLNELYPAAVYAGVVTQGLARALSSGSWSGETDITSQGGRTIHVLQEILAHPAADGSLDCFSIIARDITARQQAERAVRESEMRLRALTEQMPQSVFVKDVDSRFVSCNHRFARSLDCDPDDIIGKDDFAFYPRELAEKFRADDRSVMESNRTWQTEEKTLSHGVERWVRTTKLPYRDGLGGVVGVMCIFEDITDRRRGEDRLRALSRAIEQSPATIIITDSTGRIEYVNPKFVQITGYSSEEVVGRNPSILKSGRTAPEVYQQLWTTIAAGREWRGELLNRRKDGSFFWEFASVSPIQDESGRITHYLAVKEDITARKEAEAAQKQEEVQLRHSQKLQAIGQLAAGIAHEINTPTQFIGDNARFLVDAFGDLETVLVQSDALRRAAQQPPVPAELVAACDAAWDKADVEYLRTEIPAALRQTLEGVERVGRIVRAMKDFSHPGAEDRAPVDLNRVIESTLTVCRNEWKYVADLVTEFDTTLTSVPCLPGEFNQVILNLVINASHAIADKLGPGATSKGTITVTTRRVEPWAEVRITDSGTGIPESARDHIFVPFFTTKVVGRGTGQGLAICRSVIVDKHGGTIGFETEIGRGTTFTVRIPLVPPAASAATGRTRPTR